MVSLGGDPYLRSTTTTKPFYARDQLTFQKDRLDGELSKRSISYVKSRGFFGWMSEIFRGIGYVLSGGWLGKSFYRGWAQININKGNGLEKVYIDTDDLLEKFDDLEKGGQRRKILIDACGNTEELTRAIQTMFNSRLLCGGGGRPYDY